MTVCDFNKVFTFYKMLFYVSPFIGELYYNAVSYVRLPVLLMLFDKSITYLSFLILYSFSLYLYIKILM